MSKKDKWRDNIWDPEKQTAYNLAENIELYFKSQGIKLKIIKHGDVSQLGDGYKLQINLDKSDIRIEKMEKTITNARFKLHLPHLRLLKNNNALYLTTYSPQSTWDSLNYQLRDIWRTPEYKASHEEMEIVHPVGVTETNRIIIKDLCRCPHVIVSGTTTSGKSTALKCLIANLLQYSPKKINLILADKGYELSLFKDVPHLSCPIINEPELLAYVLLLLEDEMYRRTDLIREDKKRKLEFPYIVCVIDEFFMFMNAIVSDKRTSNVKQTIENILRLGRNANIHLILAIHDTKKDNRIINISDMPVKLEFESVNLRKTNNTLDFSDSEGLHRKGEVYYSFHKEKYHLHGVFINDQDITKKIQDMIENHTSEELSKGIFGYSISKEDVENKKTEVLEPFLSIPPTANTRKAQGNKNDELAKVILWALSQTVVSANVIKDSGACAKNATVAKNYYIELQNLGIVGGKEDSHRRLEVLPQSIEEIPDVVKKTLYKCGYSKENIIKAIANRTENR